MLQRAIKTRLGKFELPAIKTEKCASPQCKARTRIWHGYVGYGTEYSCAGRWCCSPECFQVAVWHAVCRVIAEPRRERQRTHRLPLGLLMVSQGVVDYQTVCDALEAQRTNGSGRIGDWLMKRGAVTEQQIAEAVAQQWNCALYPIDAHTGYVEFSELVPYVLLRSEKMLPVHSNTQTHTMHVAFSEAVDYAALYAVEQMTGKSTVPCVVRDSQLSAAFERIAGFPRVNQQVFEDSLETHEMARICRNEFTQCHGRDLRIVRCGDYVWMRIRGKQQMDLLFRNKWTVSVAKSIPAVGLEKLEP